MAAAVLVTQSPLADLTAQAALIVRIRTPSPAGLQAIVDADGAHARAAGGDRVEVTGSTPARVGDELAAKQAIPIIESMTEQASLEDVFLRLTSGTGTGRADWAALAAKEAAR